MRCAPAVPRFVLCVLAGGCVIGGNPVGEALGAVRVCKAHVTSKLIQDRSQKNAKRRAIADWTQRAKAAGALHPSWRIAGYKVLKCVARDGAFECVAHARPCTIKQAPPPPRSGKKKPRGADGMRPSDV